MGCFLFFNLILGCSGEGIVGLNGIEGEDECQLKTGNVLIVVGKGQSFIKDRNCSKIFKEFAGRLHSLH